MKTHDELYNKIRTRLNALIPSRLELRFGCEVLTDGEVMVTRHWNTSNDSLDVYAPGRIDDFHHEFNLYPNEYIVLGTPPTLQEILLALDLVSADIIKISANMMRIEVNEKVAIYNLSKPVKEQETSTLQAIYELIK